MLRITHQSNSEADAETQRRAISVAKPLAAAKAASLRYVSDAAPVIMRRRKGKGFVYVSPDRKTVRDPAHLDRIKSLVIPPAWADVWICAHVDGHLQAT